MSTSQSNREQEPTWEERAEAFQREIDALHGTQDIPRVRPPYPRRRPLPPRVIRDEPDWGPSIRDGAKGMAIGLIVAATLALLAFLAACGTGAWLVVQVVK